jgi:zinc transporter ZupT
MLNLFLIPSGVLFHLKYLSRLGNAKLSMEISISFSNGAKKILRSQDRETQTVIQGNSISVLLHSFFEGLILGASKFRSYHTG